MTDDEKLSGKAVLLLTFLFAGCLIAFGQESSLPTKWTKAALQATNSFPAYPRPQLEREQWMSLNGEWDYVGGKKAAAALTRQMP